MSTTARTITVRGGVRWVAVAATSLTVFAALSWFTARNLFDVTDFQDAWQLSAEDI